MNNANIRTVKALYSEKFDIEMLQDDAGRYCVSYKTYQGIEHSEWITDFGIASHIFDLKLYELEGN